MAILHNPIVHNYMIFEIQRKLYKMGITTIVIPVSLEDIDRLIDKIRDSANNASEFENITPKRII